MKRLFIAAMVAAVAVAFTGCQKKETPGAKLDKAISAADKGAKDAKKDADKAAADAQKKLNDALKK